MWMSLLVLPFEPLVQIPSLCLATEKVNRSVLDGDLSCAPALSSFNTKWIKRRVNEKKEENGLVKEKMPPRNVPHSQNILHVLVINNSGWQRGLCE